jgi:hypothetical protein
MFYGPTVTHGNLQGSPSKQLADAELENPLAVNPGTTGVGFYKVTGTRTTVQAVIGGVHHQLVRYHPLAISHNETEI